MRLLHISFLALSLTFFLNLTTALAQNKDSLSSISIKTSAQCEMCKERIEKVMLNTKGILEAELNLQENTLTVKFNPEVITVKKIKKILSKTGYDADDIKADSKAYEKLPKCCKKPEHR